MTLHEQTSEILSAVTELVKECATPANHQTKAAAVANEELQQLRYLPTTRFAADEPWMRIKMMSDQIGRKREAVLEGLVTQGELAASGDSQVKAGVWYRRWECYRQAKYYVEGFRRLWQATFVLRIDSIHSPYATLMVRGNVYYTATILVPLDSTNHIEDVPPITTQLVNRIIAALRLPTKSTRLPLYIGSDARLYIVAANAVFSLMHVSKPEPFLFDANKHRNVVRTEGFFHFSPPYNDDYHAAVQQSGILNSAIILLLTDVQRRLPDIDVETMLRENLVARRLHVAGVNVQFMGRIFSVFPWKKSPSNMQSMGEMIKRAVKLEAVVRTVKRRLRAKCATGASNCGGEFLSVATALRDEQSDEFWKELANEAGSRYDLTSSAHIPDPTVEERRMIVSVAAARLGVGVPRYNSKTTNAAPEGSAESDPNKEGKQELNDAPSANANTRAPWASVTTTVADAMFSIPLIPLLRKNAINDVAQTVAEKWKGSLVRTRSRNIVWQVDVTYFFVSDMMARRAAEDEDVFLPTVWQYYDKMASNGEEAVAAVNGRVLLEVFQSFGAIPKQQKKIRDSVAKWLSTGMGFECDYLVASEMYNFISRTGKLGVEQLAIAGIKARSSFPRFASWTHPGLRKRHLEQCIAAITLLTPASSIADVFLLIAEARSCADSVVIDAKLDDALRVACAGTKPHPFLAILSEHMTGTVAIKREEVAAWEAITASEDAERRAAVDEAIFGVVRREALGTMEEVWKEGLPIVELSVMEAEEFGRRCGVAVEEADVQCGLWFAVVGGSVEIQEGLGRGSVQAEGCGAVATCMLEEYIPAEEAGLRSTLAAVEHSAWEAIATELTDLIATEASVGAGLALERAEQRKRNEITAEEFLLWHSVLIEVVHEPVGRLHVERSWWKWMSPTIGCFVVPFFELVARERVLLLYNCGCVKTWEAWSRCNLEWREAMWNVELNSRCAIAASGQSGWENIVEAADREATVLGGEGRLLRCGLEEGRARQVVWSGCIGGVLTVICIKEEDHRTLLVADESVAAASLVLFGGEIAEAGARGIIREQHLTEFSAIAFLLALGELEMAEISYRALVDDGEMSAALNLYRGHLELIAEAEDRDAVEQQQSDEFARIEPLMCLCLLEERSHRVQILLDWWAGAKKEWSALKGSYISFVEAARRDVVLYVYESTLPKQPYSERYNQRYINDTLAVEFAAHLQSKQEAVHELMQLEFVESGRYHEYMAIQVAQFGEHHARKQLYFKDQEIFVCLVIPYIYNMDRLQRQASSEVKQRLFGEAALTIEASVPMQQRVHKDYHASAEELLKGGNNRLTEDGASNRTKVSTGGTGVKRKKQPAPLGPVESLLSSRGQLAHPVWDETTSVRGTTNHTSPSFSSGLFHRGPSMMISPIASPSHSPQPTLPKEVRTPGGSTVVLHSPARHNSRSTAGGGSSVKLAPLANSGGSPPRSFSAFTRDDRESDAVGSLIASISMTTSQSTVVSPRRTGMLPPLHQQ